MAKRSSPAKKVKLSDICAAVKKEITEKYPDAHYEQLENYYNAMAKEALLRYVPGLYPANYNGSDVKKAYDSSAALGLAITLDYVKNISNEQGGIDSRRLSDESRRDAKAITPLIEQCVAKQLKISNQPASSIQSLTFDIMKASSAPHQDLQSNAWIALPENYQDFENKMKRIGNPNLHIMADQDPYKWDEASHPAYVALLNAILLERVQGIDSENEVKKQTAALKEMMQNFIKEHATPNESLSTHAIDEQVRTVVSSFKKTVDEKLGNQRAL